MKNVVGVTGPIGAGKTSTAQMLTTKGYLRVSLSEELKKEIVKRKLPLTRQVFLDIGDDLRRKHGNETLAKRTAGTIEEIRKEKPNQKIVIDGLKNPGEITWFKENYNMYLIGITAREETRIRRVLERSSQLDKGADSRTIREELKRDLGIGQEEYGNNIKATLALSDTVIENEGSLEELEQKVDEIVT